MHSRTHQPVVRLGGKLKSYATSEVVLLQGFSALLNQWKNNVKHSLKQNFAIWLYPSIHPSIFCTRLIQFSITGCGAYPSCLHIHSFHFHPLIRGWADSAPGPLPSRTCPKGLIRRHRLDSEFPEFWCRSIEVFGSLLV